MASRGRRGDLIILVRHPIGTHAHAGPHGSTVPGERYLTALLCLLSLLLALSIFKNISYPLFWADESMTVMQGKRVLEYGYPKVHDGKNVLYDLYHPDRTLGIDEKTDAFIGGANWGMYYFATIGITLAEFSNDLYARTGIIRSTFAVAGLAGLLILALITSRFFDGRSSKLIFLIGFFFFEILSVPLALHLREARYYPLTLFFVSIVAALYAQFRILEGMRYWLYACALFGALCGLYLTFSPGYFIFFASILVYEAFLFGGKLYEGRRGGERSFSGEGSLSTAMKAALPLLLSLVVVMPLTSYFRTASIARQFLEYNTALSGMDSLQMYLGNLSVFWRFFAASDFLYLALVLKCWSVFSLRSASREGVSSGELKKARLSLFLSVLFVVYFLAIARIPNFLFTRYFIAMQPVLTIIIILDASLLYSRIKPPAFGPGRVRTLLAATLAGFVLMNIVTNRDVLEGHMHELVHQYRGPLDFIIPHIKENIKDHKDLVIATNYEEASFMYYLDAKVIVGYAGNNLEEDSRMLPDAIVYRKEWGNFRGVFESFLSQRPYRRIAFPVADSPVNNIPELNWFPPYTHQFRTQNAPAGTDRATLFLL
jgi:hypothetical protein